MSKIIQKSKSERLYVCICEQTLLRAYRETSCFSVKAEMEI